MDVRQLHDLLEDIADTREVVIASAAPDPLLSAWQAAHDEASRALAAWRAERGGEAFAAFRAAADRADAAQDALAWRVG
jgi:hypothetical protein